MCESFKCRFSGFRQIAELINYASGAESWKPAH